MREVLTKMHEEPEILKKMNEELKKMQGGIEKDA